MTIGVKRNHDTMMTPSTGEVKAAITIQKATRAFLEKRLGSYKRAIATLNENDIALGGCRSFVYLSKETPHHVIKVKRNGTRNQEDQLRLVHEMRSLLKQQKSTHIIVPKSRVYEKYLIAERLPVNINNFYNMYLYLNNLPAFDHVVRELTRLHKFKGLNDICTPNETFLSKVDGVKIRPDNLPLGLNEKGEGVVMLIDLKEVRDPRPYHLPQLARIFPYHHQIIQEEATRLSMPFNPDEIVTASDNGKKYFKLGYTDFAQYLKEKGYPPFSISKEREIELKNRVAKELNSLNEGINPIYEKVGRWYSPQGNIFPTSEIESFASRVTDLILENLKKHTDTKETKVEKEWEVIDRRTLELKRGELYEEVAELLEKETKTKESDYVADQILIVILEDLVEKGDLYFFDPGYYTQLHKRCYIRY